MTANVSRAVVIHLLAVPDTYMSSLSGFYDTFNVATELAQGRVEFVVEIVAPTEHLSSRPSRMPITPHRTLEEATQSDVVIVPTTIANGANWAPGRHPAATDWLDRVYRRGSTVCSACSGALLLAEAGLLDGREATTHWQLESTFRRHFPAVRLRLERELVASGEAERIVTSGASAAWHDLALYTIARYGSEDLAYEAAKFFMYQWHTDGQALYVDFVERFDHGDGAVLKAQAWISGNSSCASPVEGMTEQSGLAARSFKRRFREATGHTPIAYVQQVRVKQAKQMLAATAKPIEEVAWRVGYEDPSAFRRVFKRITRVTPGVYRRKLGPRKPYGIDRGASGNDRHG